MHSLRKVVWGSAIEGDCSFRLANSSTLLCCRVLALKDHVAAPMTTILPMSCSEGWSPAYRKIFSRKRSSPVAKKLAHQTSSFVGSTTESSDTYLAKGERPSR